MIKFKIVLLEEIIKQDIIEMKTVWLKEINKKRYNWGVDGTIKGN